MKNQTTSPTGNVAHWQLKRIFPLKGPGFGTLRVSPTLHHHAESFLPSSALLRARFFIATGKARSARRLISLLCAGDTNDFLSPSGKQGHPLRFGIRNERELATRYCLTPNSKKARNDLISGNASPSAISSIHSWQLPWDASISDRFGAMGLAPNPGSFSSCAARLGSGLKAV
jgi:hypothetical protein